MNAADRLAQRAYEHAPKDQRVKLGFQTPLTNTLGGYQLEIKYLDHLADATLARIADNEDQAANGQIPR